MLRFVCDFCVIKVRSAFLATAALFVVLLYWENL